MRCQEVCVGGVFCLFCFGFACLFIFTMKVGNECYDIRCSEAIPKRQDIPAIQNTNDTLVRDTRKSRKNVIDILGSY